MRLLIACVLSLLFWSHAHAQDKQDVSTDYLTKPLPAAWVPAPASPSKLQLRDVLSPARPPRTISGFIVQFGAPDLYMTPERKLPGYDGRLIYQLSTGHTVTLHVGQPPLQSIGAIAVRDKDGKEIRLIK